jgi:hypothetical protein
VQDNLKWRSLICVLYGWWYFAWCIVSWLIIKLRRLRGSRPMSMWTWDVIRTRLCCHIVCPKVLGTITIFKGLILYIKRKRLFVLTIDK